MGRLRNDAMLFEKAISYPALRVGVVVIIRSRVQNRCHSCYRTEQKYRAFLESPRKCTGNVERNCKIMSSFP